MKLAKHAASGITNELPRIMVTRQVDVVDGGFLIFNAEDDD
jgi:hypothetical protein